MPLHHVFEKKKIFINISVLYFQFHIYVLTLLYKQYVPETEINKSLRLMFFYIYYFNIKLYDNKIIYSLKLFLGVITILKFTFFQLKTCMKTTYILYHYVYFVK